MNMSIRTAGGRAILVAAVVLIGAILSVRAVERRLDRVRTALVERSRDLEEARRLAGEILDVNGLEEAVVRSARALPAGYNPAARLRSILRERIGSPVPEEGVQSTGSERLPSGILRESLRVEIRSIPLEQALGIFYDLDRLDAPIGVQRLELTAGDEPPRFDLVLEIVAFVPPAS